MFVENLVETNDVDPIILFSLFLSFVSCLHVFT